MGCCIAAIILVVITSCGGSSSGGSFDGGTSSDTSNLPKPSVTVLSSWFTIPGDRDTDHNYQEYRVVMINGLCFIQADGAYQHTQLTLAQYAAGSNGALVSACEGNDIP